MLTAVRFATDCSFITVLIIIYINFSEIMESNVQQESFETGKRRGNKRNSLKTIPGAVQ